MLFNETLHHLVLNKKCNKLDSVPSFIIDEHDLQYKYLFTNKADRDEKAKELDKMAQIKKSYKVGAEIDVIEYKNCKFVKLYYMK